MLVVGAFDKKLCCPVNGTTNECPCVFNLKKKGFAFCQHLYWKNKKLCLNK